MPSYDVGSFAMHNQPKRPLIFPKWVDGLRPFVALLLLGGPVYVLALLYYGGSPKATDVGYMPEQPVPYSHALHAGKLGIDCRYCHNTVERTGYAAIPPTATCMNCHTNIYPQSPKLVAVRESYSTGLPVRWVKVHDLPNYAYFNHSAHVTRGVGCVECHGRVDKMEVVYQVQTLSMGFCLDCHRNPDARLRPVSEVTNMSWEPEEDRAVVGARLREQHNIHPNEDCSTCHR
jgi:hypothetical protein